MAAKLGIHHKRCQEEAPVEEQTGGHSQEENEDRDDANDASAPDEGVTAHLPKNGGRCLMHSGRSSLLGVPQPLTAPDPEVVTASASARRERGTPHPSRLAPV